MITLAGLEQALKIDRFNLDEEMVRQPELFMKAGEAAAQLRSQVDKAKHDLDLLEAELDKLFRSTHEQNEEKYTEKSLAMEIQRDSGRVEAYNEYLKKRLRLERYEQMRDAFRQRGYVLRDLVALHIAGYYSSDGSTGKADATEKAMQARAEYNRARMTEKRKERK